MYTAKQHTSGLYQVTRVTGNPATAFTSKAAAARHVARLNQLQRYLASAVHQYPAGR